MKIVSLDLETTGIDPKVNQIIEFAMVVENTNQKRNLSKLPRYHRYVVNKQYVYSTNTFAHRMNAPILDKLNNKRYKVFIDHVNFSGSDEFVTIAHLIFEAKAFLKKHLNADERTKQFTIIGKNAGSFDWLFLLANGWNDDCNPGDDFYSPRFLDPTLLYMDLRKDKGVIGTKELMKRAEVDNLNLHSALADAMMMIEIFRKKY